MANQNDHQSGENKRLITRILKVWYWIAIGGVVGLALAVLFYHFQKPKYDITATLLINDHSDEADLSDVFQGKGNYEKKSPNMINQIGILKAFSLNLQTVKNLDWQFTWYKTDEFFGRTDIYMNEPYQVLMTDGFVQTKGIPITVVPLAGDVVKVSCDEETKINGVEKHIKFSQDLPLGDKFENEYFSFTLNPDEGRSVSGDSEFQLEFKDMSLLALVYQSSMNIKLDDDESKLLHVSFQTVQPARAVHYLNELSDVYIQFGLDEKNRIANKTFNFIDNQISSITESLQSAGQEFTDYRSQHRIMDLSQQAQNVGDKLQDIEKEERMTRVELDYYQSIQQYLKNSDLESLVAPSVVGITDQTLQNLVVKLTDQNAAREVLSYTVQDKNPQLIELDKQINYTKSVLEENINNLLNNTQRELSNIVAQKSTINGQLSSLPVKEQEMVNIKRRFDLNDELYTYLLQRRAEVGIVKASNNPDAQVLDPARMETSLRIGPGRVQWAIIGLMAGLFIPLLFIVVIDKLDDRIASVPEAERLLDVPVAGQLVHSKFKEELPTIIYPQAAITESFRGLRTNVQYMLKSREGKVLGINSMYVREGKTFVTTNIASILALNNKKVLLIDADLRKPRAYKVLKMKNDKGLSTFLNNKHTIDEVVTSTRISGLDFIAAGPIPMYPAELISNGPMDHLMEWAKANYDYIIIDNSPADLVSDALLIGKYTDLNLFVLRIKYSKKGEINSINKLRKDGTLNNIIVAINDVTPDASGKSFKGYGYYREVKATKSA